MSAQVSPQPPARPQMARRRPGKQPQPPTAVVARRSQTHATVTRLGAYLDNEGRSREIVALPGYAGSLLVLDRDAATLCERRLVAHLAADEPPENAELICRLYIQDERGRWCRAVRPHDLEIDPLAQTERRKHDESHERHRIADRDGNFYRLGPIENERVPSQLRWHRRSAHSEDCPLELDVRTWEPISLREVIAALENYEPVRRLTEQAISRRDGDPTVSRLRTELDRLAASPVVLNRGLREAVLRAIDRGDTSMSEIALRCGVVKRDRRGNPSGETSWLARRIGVMPEGGRAEITPWIHSDVLGVIAREGLGLSPREVELQ
jgi:hypothetical protein